MVIRLFIKVLIVTTFLCGCSKDIRTPIKAACLPQGARWYGGADGGVWIFIVEEDRNIYYAEVYAENDDCSLWAKGHYMPHNNCFDFPGRPPIQDVICYFDGINIVLKNKDMDLHCLLVPLKESQKGK